MRTITISLKCGLDRIIKTDTETLDSLLADWKAKVTRVTRYKGVMWHSPEVDAYLFLVPSTITSIMVGEWVNES
jgi:hypothetical protein